MEHWNHARKHFPVQTSNTSKLKNATNATQQKHSFAATLGTAQDICNFMNLPRHMLIIIIYGRKNSHP